MRWMDRLRMAMVSLFWRGRETERLVIERLEAMLKLGMSIGVQAWWEL